MAHRHVRLRPARGARLGAAPMPTPSTCHVLVLVSTLSVYPDDAPVGTDEETPRRGQPFPDTEEIGAKWSGPLKVACELEAQQAFPGTMPDRSARLHSSAAQEPS